MGWLKNHLETFVEPVSKELGTIPSDPWLNEIRGSYYKRLTPEQMTVVKNAWRAAKSRSEGKTLLLMGRDVWIFEVLARREGYPTIFDPSCSRQTCYHEKFKKFDSKRHILLDTGFAGSIATALKVKCLLLSADIHPGSPVAKSQIFPLLTGSRSLALFLENLPKYWESAQIVNGEIQQKYSHVKEFRLAAQLTQDVYKDSSPRFVARRKPLGETMTY
jgi:hypothetical protein